MNRVELFEIIRREHKLHGKSIRVLAKEHGVHRRVVRQALRSSIPPVRRKAQRDPKVLTNAMRAVIDGWLEGDRTVHRKQRHTARRVFTRLQSELDYLGSESTVRHYVSRRRREIGLAKNVFIPLCNVPGAEAEIDWYEADVRFPWGLERVQFFQMRACFSGREFHMAFPRQTQQAFLEGHVHALAHFGGVFETLRYDNLGSAVQKVLRGRRRKETANFVAFRSHYLFQSVYCIPGKQGAHEKGGVEGAVGRFRRNHLVPVPVFDDYKALNRFVLDGCATDDLRRIEGRPSTISEDWAQERPRLRDLPAAPFCCAEVCTVRVDAMGRIKQRTNCYSVPIRLAHQRVECRVHANQVDIVHGGKCVASHPRLHGRYEERLELDHYIELLWHKPGALPRARPLKQAKQQGTWPQSYDQLYKAMAERFEQGEAARQMLAVLMLHREHDTTTVFACVEQALVHGCYDAGAVAALIRQKDAPHSQATALQGLGELTRYERPVQSLNDYDMLLNRQKDMEMR